MVLFLCGFVAFFVFLLGFLSRDDVEEEGGGRVGAEAGGVAVDFLLREEEDEDEEAPAAPAAGVVASMASSFSRSRLARAPRDAAT